MSDEIKEVVSVAEMARMVGLSRARFYQLLGTTFPFPIYDVATRRPFYTEEQQAKCLDVRKRNCGIDGKPILFYSRRVGALPQRRSTQVKSRDNRFASVVDGMKALGLPNATHDQVVQVIKELYPDGGTPTDPGELIRSVFVHLKRRESGDSVGR